MLFIEVINTFLGADSQRLPDEHGSTLFQFFFNPDSVPMEHLSSEAIQVNKCKSVNCIGGLWCLMPLSIIFQL